MASGEMDVPTADELPREAMEQSVNDGDEQEPPCKKGRRGNGLPRGVSGPNQARKYVGRASFKAEPQGKAQQRHLGCFDTVEKAAAAVKEAEAELASGNNPWHAPVRVNQHKVILINAATATLR